MAATAGDYLIMSDGSDTSTLPDEGSNLDLTFDTTVASKGSSITYSGGEFTLASGKYLVMYSQRFDADTGDATERIEIQGRLVIDSSEVVTGACADYCRNITPNWVGILEGAGILDISSDNTILEVRFRRTDGETNASVDRVVDWGGITILALDSSWDYGRYSLASPISPTPNGYADLVWDTNDEQDTGFSRSSGEITLTTAGLYLVTWAIPLVGDTGEGRSNLSGRITLDDTVHHGTMTSTYIRGDNTDSTHDGCLSGVALLEVAANDVLAYEIDVDTSDDANDIDVPAGANIQIVELPSGTEAIIATATTGEMNPDALTEFAWDSTQYIDTDSFTMGAGTDSYFEVDENDDYLIFFNLFSNANNITVGYRPTVSGRISIDDTILEQGVGGRYGKSNTTDDLGYASGLIANGLTSGQDVSLEVIKLADDESISASSGAISAIRLGTLFAAAASDISKISGVAQANISKVSGVAAASIKEVSGVAF